MFLSFFSLAGFCQRINQETCQLNDLMLGEVQGSENTEHISVEEKEIGDGENKTAERKKTILSERKENPTEMWD